MRNQPKAVVAVGLVLTQTKARDPGLQFARFPARMGDIVTPSSKVSLTYQCRQAKETG